MATRDEIYSAIRNADKAGDAESVRKLGAYLQTMPAATGAPDEPQAGSRARAAATSDGILTDALKNIIPGAIRGAGSIGATLMTPTVRYDDKGKPDGTGYLQRRQENTDAQEGALRDMGADPSNPGFKLGKFGAEVAGTAGAGNALAAGVRAAPVIAQAAPRLVNAIGSAGMTTGAAPAANLLGRAGDLAVRSAGGVVTGAATAGLVNPADAGAGAAIGGAFPLAAKAAGLAGQKVGNVLRGPEQTPELAAAVTSARDAGYVIPPTQARPTLANRVIEGVSGKITTAQNASAKNQTVTGKLVAQDLGLPADTAITPEVLSNIRQQAGQAYGAISKSGTITPGKAYSDALDKIAGPHATAAQGFPGAKPSPVLDLVESLRSPSFDASSAVAKVKELRSAADDAFRSGNTDVARASKAAAGALEDAIEAHLQQSGNPSLLKDFRDARQLIAKTYSAEKALNPVSGSVDARKLAAQLAKGKPLTGGMREAAEFAARFPKAAQTPEGMGSLPGTSPLDWVAGGAMSAATANPFMLATVAARPAARALALSPVVQNSLVQGPSAASRLPLNALNQLGYRVAPLSGSDR